MKKVLVLYSELAGYTIACLRRYAEWADAEVHVVRWPVHADAPFQFEATPGIVYHERKRMDVAAMIALGEQIQPAGVYVSGWIDKDYLKVAKHFRKKGLPVIAAFDTHWRGDFRQRLAAVISPFFFRKIFTHCWVPGMYQYEYARRLGFPKTMIYTGMYSADVARFRQGYAEAMERKAEAYPKTLLYVGRFIEDKGILELYEAFKELSKEMDHGWKLLLVGNGPLQAQLQPTENIEMRSFVQPGELALLGHQVGAFILPSRYEAWGVVVHEFAAAGLPLILAECAGAAAAFLRPGYNGFLHRSESVDSIKWAMRRMFELSPEARLEMGRRSHVLSQQISPDTWATTLDSILQPH